MVELERRERGTIYMSTEDKIIHFSNDYARSNNLNLSIAQGQKPQSSDFILESRRI